MTTTQLFLSLVGVMVALFGSQIVMVKMYVDAKIDGAGKRLDEKIDGGFNTTNSKLDGLTKSVDQLIQYMISHEGRISTLEERTKGKAS
jgi:hypothetical protein